MLNVSSVFMNSGRMVLEGKMPSYSVKKLLKHKKQEYVRFVCRIAVFSYVTSP